MTLHATCLKLLPVILVSAAWLTSSGNTAELSEFAVIKGLKCDTRYNRSSKPFKAVDDVSLKQCVQACADTKPCRVAQYNKKTDKCKMWKKDKCGHTTDEFDKGDIEDFSMIGLAGKNGFFEVPNRPTHDYGQDCATTWWKSKDTSDEKKCIQWCRRNKKCVATAYNYDSYYRESWCTFYKKCDKGEEYYEGPLHFYLKPNFEQ